MACKGEPNRYWICSHSRKLIPSPIPLIRKPDYTGGSHLCLYRIMMKRLLRNGLFVTTLSIFELRLVRKYVVKVDLCKVAETNIVTAFIINLDDLTDKRHIMEWLR